MLWKIATATIINDALPFIVGHQTIIVHGSVAIDGPPEGGTPNLLEHLFDHSIASFKSFTEFLGLGATAFSHVGFAAALAADDWRRLFDDLSSRNSLRETVSEG